MTNKPEFKLIERPHGIGDLLITSQLRPGQIIMATPGSLEAEADIRRGNTAECNCYGYVIGVSVPDGIVTIDRAYRTRGVNKVTLDPVPATRFVVNEGPAIVVGNIDFGSDYQMPSGEVATYTSESRVLPDHNRVHFNQAAARFNATYTQTDPIFNVPSAGEYTLPQLLQMVTKQR